MSLKIVSGAVIVIVLVAGAYYLGVRHAKAPVVSEEVSPAVSADEHASEGDNRMSAAAAALVGKWQSNEDSKFSREFKADGTLMDSYEGASADQPGTWSLFTKESPDPSFTGPVEEGPVYLKITAGQDLLFFKITAVTPEALDLIYLDRGGALTFKKIN